MTKTKNTANRKLQVVSDDGDMIILFDSRDGSYRLGFRSLSMDQVVRFENAAAMEAYFASIE
jgi:hypothetical protein